VPRAEWVSGEAANAPAHVQGPAFPCMAREVRPDLRRTHRVWKLQGRSFQT